MAETPSDESKDQNVQTPAPEELQPQVDDAVDLNSVPAKSTDAAKLATARLRRVTYRPSHKATFVGLAVIIVILAINGGVIAFVLKGQSKNKTQPSQSQVTLSPGVLNKLGVSRNAVGDTGLQLTVGPNAHFNGKVQVDGDLSIAGQFKLNSKLSANDASLAQLQAGNTSLSQLDVNGDTTLSGVNLRKDLTVVGATKLQGAVTVTQLFTVNNSVNITGNLSIGGIFSVNSVHASSLTTDSTLTIGGHVITRGSAPGVSPGTALGTNGTISISGNDAAGTVAANIGTGANAGIIANVAFRNQYDTLPHVVVTGVGSGNGSIYINRTTSGFSIGVNNALAPGGYAFDYIVEQ